jgi:hypothetical protein
MSRWPVPVPERSLRNWEHNPWLRMCLWYVPALGYLPLLDLRIPSFTHSIREIAGAFQALAFLESGFGALLYSTPAENLSGVHLHSLLSAPLVFVGYFEGGRLISFVAAILAVTVVGFIAAHLFDWRVGTLAPLFLWIQPLFSRFTYSFKPESLSIALTLLIVYLALRYDETDDRRLLGAMLVLIPITTGNHLWEASIALPVTALFLSRRRILEAAATIGTSLMSVLLVLNLANLKDLGPGQLSSSFAIFANGNLELVLTPGWWFYWWPADPFDVPTGLRRFLADPWTGSIGLLLPLSVLLGAWWAFRAYRQPSKRAVLLAAWFASGIAIPVALPGGFPSHEYYHWALLAPLALTGAVVATVLWTRLVQGVSTDWAKPVTAMTVLLLLVLAVGAPLQSGPFARAHLSGDLGGTLGGSGSLPDFRTEPVRVGQELSARGIDEPAAVTFVGDYASEFGNNYLTRTLLYAGIVPRQRSFDGTSPPLVATRDEAGDCEVMVLLQDDDTMRIQPCS